MTFGRHEMEEFPYWRRLTSTSRRLSAYLAAAVLGAGIFAIVGSALWASREPPGAVEDDRVVVENRLPGTDEWRLTRVADDRRQQIKGYASATSVNVGQRIDFFVTVHPAQNYSVDIFRIGYYQGTGGRLVERMHNLPGAPQTPCPLDSATGMVACNWWPGYSLTVPETWTSGVFLAKLTNAEGFQNYITFVVRDDTRKSGLLYQQSVTTYQAYNNYPNDAPPGSAQPATGKSLYDFNSSTRRTSVRTHRAVKVSYDRPYSGDGGGEFLEHESYFVRWMEQNGYDATYSTNVDTDLHGEWLRDHRGFLSVGHDEYWSAAMVDAATVARDRGVGLGFFGADAVYWQIRFEPSSDGRPHRVQVCYKDAALDPVKDSRATEQWRNPPVNRAEQQLVGGMFIAQQPAGAPPAPYVVTNGGHWVYAGTGLRDGDAVPGIVGYEADRRVSDAPPPAAVPGTYVALSRSPFATMDEGSQSRRAAGTEHQESTVYQAQSGAWVFNAGTIRWSWGLYDDAQTDADPRIQRMTANVLNRFLLGPAPPPPAPAASTATPTAQGGYTCPGRERPTSPDMYSIAAPLPPSAPAFTASDRRRPRPATTIGESPRATATTGSVRSTRMGSHRTPMHERPPSRGSIGARNGTGYPLVGTVDEAAIHRSAPRPVQISQHYRAARYRPAPR